MERRRVVVGGAINTDLVATTIRAPGRGETVTGSGFAIHGGGKGANQAVAAARSGATVAIVGGVGSDAFGQARLADLHGEAIDTTAVVTVADAASGVALITVEEGGDNRIVYVPGATLALDAEQAMTGLGDNPIGVLLLTLELAPDLIDRLISRGRSDGATIIFNATPEPLGAVPFLDRVDLLIVNEVEASTLAGGDRDGREWDRIGRDILARGPGAVVMTVGADGAIAVTADGIFRVPAIPVNVIDTTGAGDTLCGALVAALARGASLEEAIRFGVVAGSLACEVAGAQPSIPRRTDIEAAIAARLSA